MLPAHHPQVPSSKPKAVAGISFTNYGSHHDAYPCVYFTVACALGITQPEIDLFLKKLGAPIVSRSFGHGRYSLRRTQIELFLKKLGAP